MEIASTLVSALIAVVVSVSYGMSETMRATDYVLVNQVWEYDTIKKEDDYHHFAVASLDHSATWNNGTALLILSWMMLAAPLLQLLARAMGWLQYKYGYNPVRWVTESILNPLLVVITIVFLGDTSTFGLFSAFALVHAYTLGGLFLEVINAPVSLAPKDAVSRTIEDEEAENETKEVTATTTVTYWPVAFSAWLSALAIVAPLTLMITTASLRYISSWEYGAIAALVVYQTYMSAIQLAYYMHLYQPSNPNILFAPIGKTDDAVTKFSPKNHDAYQKYLTAGNLSLRSLVVILLLVVSTQKNYYYFPDSTQCQSSYAACQPSVDAGSTSTLTTMRVKDVCHDAMDTMSVVNLGGGHGVDTSNTDFGAYPPQIGADESHASLQASFSADCDNAWAQASSCIAYTLAGVVYQSRDPGFNMKACCNANRPDVQSPDDAPDNAISYSKDSQMFYSSCTCLKMTKQMTNTYGNNIKNKELGAGKDKEDTYKMTITKDSDNFQTIVDYDGVKVRYTPDVAMEGTPSSR